MTSFDYDPNRPHFPDVNVFRRVTDWNALASAASAASCVGMKVSEGTREDPTFASNLQNAEARGLLVIGYHFGIGSTDPATQAAAFLQYFPPKPGRLPCLDFERDKNFPMMSVQQAGTWIAQVHQSYGRWPIFYSHSDWINAGQPSGTVVSNCPYWGPTYGPRLDVPAGVGTPIAWQYTDGVKGPTPHTFPGVPPCDISELLVAPSTLRTLAGLGAHPTPVPAGVLEVFYRGTDNALWTRWRNADGTWSAEQHIGGVLEGTPAAAAIPGTKVLQAFYPGSDNALWSRWPNADGTWSVEQRLGGALVGGPAAAAIPIPGKNVLQVFYRGSDNALWSRWREPDGTWSGEQRLGGVLSSSPAAAAIPGTEVLQVFYRGSDNALWSRWREPDGSWSGEQRLGGVLSSSPAAAAIPIPGKNVLQVFYRGSDNALWSRWREPDGTWSGEQRLGGVLSSGPAAAAIPGKEVLQVFYRGTDNAVWTRWREPDGSWSVEGRIGGVLSSGLAAADVPS